MPDTRVLQQAIQAIQSGDNATAQHLLRQLLALEPNNDQAWLWLAICLPDPEKQRFCLQKALSIRPDNLQARQALQQLESRLASATPPIASPGQEAQPEEAQAVQATPAIIDEGELPGEKVAQPAADSPAEQTPPAGRRVAEPARPAPRKKSAALNPVQLIFLLFLGLAAIVALAGVGVLIFQNSALLPRFAASSPAAPGEAASPVVRPAFALPPTWTSTLEI